MKILKTKTHLEVEYNDTTFQVPKQFGEKLYIRLLGKADDYIIIQIEFPETTDDPEKLAISYNMEPEKRQFVSDSDLQNVGEAILLLVGVIDEQHNIIVEESDRQPVISEESHMSS